MDAKELLIKFANEQNWSIVLSIMEHAKIDPIVDDEKRVGEILLDTGSNIDMKTLLEFDWIDVSKYDIACIVKGFIGNSYADSIRIIAKDERFDLSKNDNELLKYAIEKGRRGCTKAILKNKKVLEEISKNGLSSDLCSKLDDDCKKIVDKYIKSSKEKRKGEILEKIRILVKELETL